MVDFHGIIPPVPTIVYANGSFNKTGMQNMIDADITGGVNGLFFLGSAGEVMHMTDKLRSEMLEFSVDYTHKRVPVLAGAIACGTSAVIEYAKEAEKFGADALVLLNPYYANLSEDALYRHFAKIMDKVSIPAFLYNLPSSTGQSLSVELIKRIAVNIPNIIGLKDTVDTISHIRAVIVEIKEERPDFKVFCGFDEYLLSTLMIGGDGCVPASANFAPHLTCGIYEAFQKGDYATIQKLQKQLSYVPPLYQMGPPFFGAMKEAIKLSGVDITTDVLMPALMPDAATKQAIATIMAKIKP